MKYLVIMAFLLTACASQPRIPISQGMNEAEVRQAWGSPYTTRTSSHGSTWTYKEYYGRTLGSKWSFVQFDRAGKVIYWSKGQL